MKECMHLIKGKTKACEALEKTYFPSLYQFVEYCRSSEYKKCPFYLKGLLRVHRLESHSEAPDFPGRFPSLTGGIKGG